MYCELLCVGFLLDNAFNLPTDRVCHCSWFVNIFFSSPLLTPGCVFPLLFPQAVTSMELTVQDWGWHTVGGCTGRWVLGAALGLCFGVIRGPMGWQGPRKSTCLPPGWRNLHTMPNCLFLAYLYPSASGACLGERNGKTASLLKSVVCFGGREMLLSSQALRPNPTGNLGKGEILFPKPGSKIHPWEEQAEGARGLLHTIPG